MMNKQIKIKSPVGKGILRFSSKAKPSTREGIITIKETGLYELQLEKGKEYVVTYSAL